MVFSSLYLKLKQLTDIIQGGPFDGTEKGPLDGTEMGCLDGTAVRFSAVFIYKCGF